MSETDDGMEDRSFNAFFEKRGRETKSEVAKRRAAEARSHRAVDGRISSTIDKKGLVQLNIRVPVDVKNKVVELSARRKAEGSGDAGVGDIVTEALLSYLSAMPRG